MHYAGAGGSEHRWRCPATFRGSARFRSRVTLVDAKGIVFADSEKEITGLENHLYRPEIQEARLRGKGKFVRYSSTLGVDMLYGCGHSRRKKSERVMSVWPVRSMMFKTLSNRFTNPFSWR